MGLLLAGCGPARPEADSIALMDQTQQIGLDYAANRDLAAAQTALGELDVPNQNQWLVLAAETAIAAGESSEADGLALLVTDLNLRSAGVSRYVAARGIAGNTAGNAAESAANSSGQQPASQPDSQAVAQATDQPQAEQPSPTATDAPAQQPAEVAPTNTPLAESPATDTPTPQPTATPVPGPEVRISSPMNVRAGPGTFHPVRTTLQPGDSAAITGKNPAGDWWEIRLSDGNNGWIYGPLVETAGDTARVAVAAAIPTAPPATPTPIPLPTNTPAPAAPTATPVPAGPDFRLTQLRLWDVEENGGFLSGESVNCGEKQVIRVEVLDAAGNPLNGVTVLGVYRNEARSTGEKGPGIAEFDVNVDGDDIIILRDVDGREVTSDRAKGLTAKTYNISFENLIAGRFCRDAASCQAFVDTFGCFGHFSWTARFQRSY